MECMYNVYTWSTQLSSRLAAGALLVAAEAAEGHGHQHRRTSPDDLVARSVRRLEEDCRYHGELFSDPSAVLLRGRIEALGLPHCLVELGEQLLSQCAVLLHLALRALGAMAT